jgi:hypothetical protein
MSMIDTTAIENAIRTFVDANGEGSFSPYKIGTMLRELFGMLELPVPNNATQMMYNYDKNGLIVKGVRGRKADPGYTADEVSKFFTRFALKKMINA